MSSTNFEQFKTPINADWLNEVNAATFGGSAVYTPSGTGAVATTAQAKMRESVSVKDFGAKGDGVTDDYAAITAAITYLNGIGGGVLYFPRGTYIHNTTLVFKNYIIYQGEGGTGYTTTLKYSGASDQIQVNNPINGNTSAYITVQDIYFWATTTTAKKANFADIGSSYLNLTRCTFVGNEYGVILDQSEIVLVDSCTFGAHTVGSLWMVNGADHTPGGIQYFTNRITISNNQFNESATCDLIVDDGGTVHVIENNNFNAGAIQIRSAGPRNIRITGNEFEACSVQCVRFSTTTKYGSTLLAGSGAEVTNNFFVGLSSVSAPHNSLIDFNPNCLTDVALHSNSFYQDVGMPIPTTDPRPYVSFIHASNNINRGTMTASVPFNNVNQDTTWVPVVGGSTTLGSGTYSAQLGRYVQNGNTHQFEAQITWSAHTGTGAQMYVSLPKAVVANGPQFYPVSIASSGITLAANEQIVGLVNTTSAPFGASGVIQLYKSALGVLSPLAMATSGTLYVSGSFVAK